MSRPVALVDPLDKRIAELNVQDCGSRYQGTLSLGAARPEVRDLFSQFEEIVEGQMFSFIDEIEDQIDHLDLRVLFEDGSRKCVEDLQVYPSTNAVSFKIRQPLVHSAGKAPFSSKSPRMN